MAQGFGPPLQNFAPLANLGQAFTQAYDSAQKRGRDQEQRQTLAMLGQTLASGNPDYMTAAGRTFNSGNADLGLGLIKLGEAAKERQSERDILQSWSGGGTPASPVAPSAPGAAPTSLIQNESGGRWDAQNNAVGAGGLRGHFGRIQFGQARLQEAQAAGAIPAGTTPQQFMASPEMQQRAEAWHWNDIDNHIRQTGLDRAIGQTINGVPVTVEGMRAVAHLGGKKGLSQFIATGGRYNPSDENGTRLSDYFARHGGRGGAQVAAPIMPVQQAQLAAPGVQVAENEADVQRLEAQMAAQAAPVQMAQAPAQPGTPVADLPAQGAAPAQFTIPGAPAGEQQSISNDPKVQLWSQRLAGATTERLRTIAKQQLDLATKDAERRYAEGKAPESVREWQWARQNGLTEAKSPVAYAKEKSEGNPATMVSQRRAAAAAAGLRETDPGYQAYILTGKMPREDAQPLSATDKKAILEADEGVASGESAIRALKEAKGLSKQAMSGPTAGWRAAAGNNLPDWMVPDVIASPAASEATANLENTVTSNALSQMKAIFGGNPTEGERKILLDIQGSIGQPDNVRQGIYDRAIRAAEARLKFNRERAAELRGGTYYKPGTGEPGAQPRQSADRAPTPDVSNAKQASDGNWYVPDPSRPGKYLMVQP